MIRIALAGLLCLPLLARAAEPPRPAPTPGPTSEPVTTNPVLPPTVSGRAPDAQAPVPPPPEVVAPR